MNKKLVILLALTAFIASVECHGRMMEPVNRGSVWRLPLGMTEPKFPDIMKIDTEWCEFDDLNDIRNRRNVTCGICGPVYLNDPALFRVIFKDGLQTYENVTSFEKGSSMYDGRIVRIYQTGATVTAKVRIAANHKGNVQFRICNADGKCQISYNCIFKKIAANHKGVVQFRICNADGLENDPKMECFDQNILKFEDGSQEYVLNDGMKIYEPRYSSNGRQRGVEEQFAFNVKLPKKLKCDHCIFQWKWFKTDTNQVYYGCSDVKIKDL